MDFPGLFFITTNWFAPPTNFHHVISNFYTLLCYYFTFFTRTILLKESKSFYV